MSKRILNVFPSNKMKSVGRLKKEFSPPSAFYARMTAMNCMFRLQAVSRVQLQDERGEKGRTLRNSVLFVIAGTQQPCLWTSERQQLTQAFFILLILPQ